jgi:hypothetical protein
MGLPCEEIHFSTSAPALEAIYQTICEIEGTDVPAMMKRTPAPPSITNAPPKPSSRAFGPDSLCLYGARADLDIHVSEDGQNVFAMGNAALLRSSRLALEKLGGAIVKPTPLVRPRMPVREWPWYLVVSLLSLLVTVCIGLPLVIFVFAYLLPRELVSSRRERREEKWLRRWLASVGRSVPASELDAKLNSGEGTLMIEHLLPQDFVREWWTEEDVIGNASVPLPKSPILPPDENQSTALNTYALSCRRRYTDPTTGIGKLTETVPELSASHRELAEKYPRAKIIVLLFFNWGDNLVFNWDAERSLIFRSGFERIAESGFNHG